ncbi:diaminopimelate decarboxylase [Magnetococcales bacterium HHB-1]
MDHFHYRENRLFCEDVAIEEIAKAVGTPFFCYAKTTLEQHLKAFQSAFLGQKALICYSVKANSNLAVLDTLIQKGAGVDIVSLGELERAKKVRCPPERIVFSGVGKRTEEIKAAIDYDIRMFNVESVEELERIHQIASDCGRKARIALRINPDVDPKTHPHISTGLKKNKFGIPANQAIDTYLKAAKMPFIEIKGLDCHIGSQLTSLSPFIEAVKKIKPLLTQLKEQGITITDLDLGGGLGVPYRNEDHPPSPEDYAKALAESLSDWSGTLILEPGRAIAANAGILVCGVEYVKEGEGKSFVILDSGMNDLIRPSLYQAYHKIIPVTKKPNRDKKRVDVVGPICESGDYFARDRDLKRFHPGELLAVRSAGAYGFVMSGNYNSRPRPAEVMVKKDRFAIIRKRETLTDLWRGETLFS